MNRGSEMYHLHFKALESDVAIHPQELKCTPTIDLSCQRSQESGPRTGPEETGDDRVAWLRWPDVDGHAPICLKYIQLKNIYGLRYLIFSTYLNYYIAQYGISTTYEKKKKKKTTLYICPYVPPSFVLGTRTFNVLSLTFGTSLAPVSNRYHVPMSQLR